MLHKIDYHPNIISLHEIGRARGYLYLVMEYVDGLDAEDLIIKWGAMEIGPAVDVICQTLDALAHAHRVGIVHRDIKPSNLLVTERGKRKLVKLGDFGLADLP